MISVSLADYSYIVYDSKSSEGVERGPNTSRVTASRLNLDVGVLGVAGIWIVEDEGRGGWRARVMVVMALRLRVATGNWCDDGSDHDKTRFHPSFE